MKRMSPLEAPRPLHERALFFRHWVSRPLGIGAALPSGRAVARAMAGALSHAGSGPVLELGGGTGSLTAGLIEAGCSSADLIVVEREPALAATLRRRFRDVRIIEADARIMGPTLAAMGIDSVSAVVSSLPIRWFSVVDQRAVIGPCFERIGPGGGFLQLTNGFSSPLAIESLQLRGEEVVRLWAALLPVQIWRYCAR